MIKVYSLMLLLISSNFTFSQSKKELKAIIQNQGSELRETKIKYSDLQSQHLAISSKTKEYSKKIEDLKKENSDLLFNIDRKRDTIEILKKKLDEINNGPINLLRKANLNYKSENYDLAFYDYNQLILQFPTSIEAVEAKNGIIKTNQKLEVLKEAKKIKMEEERKREDEKNIIIEKDDFKKRTFYSDKRGDQYHYDINNIVAADLKLNLYFSIPYKSKLAEGLYLTIGYKHDDWLFINKATFLIDGKQYEVNGNFERDSGNGDVYEWIERSVTGNILTIVNAIVKSKNTRVRFNGDKYYSDIIVNEDQKIALANILLLYKNKGGRLR